MSLILSLGLMFERARVESCVILVWLDLDGQKVLSGKGEGPSSSLE
jgi:hypothetical protein